MFYEITQTKKARRGGELHPFFLRRHYPDQVIGFDLSPLCWGTPVS